MACQKCNDCKDNGCTPIVYPKCFVIDKKYACLGLKPGDTGADLLKVLNDACALWGGGNLTFNNGLTKTGSVVQLGGTLIKDTNVDTLGKTLTIGSLTNASYLYGVQWSETINGLGTPGTALGIQKVGGGDGANIANFLQGGKYKGLWVVNNGNNEAQITLDDTKAVLRYSPDGGTTNILVRVDNSEITLDGQGRRTKFDATQVQETSGITLPSNSTLQIDTTGNLFPVSGTNTIDVITGPGATLTNIQSGTRITLQFSSLTPGLVRHGQPPIPGAAAIFLNGCIDFQPSQGDTLSLVYNGQDWSEVGRKMCADPIVQLIQDVADLQACVLDASGNCKVPETWKTLGAAGNMRNGEPIPSLTIQVTAPLVTRLRQVDDTHAEINFSAGVEVNGLGIADLFTMPVGYRGSTLLIWQVAAVSSTSTDTAIGNLFVDPGTGEVRVTVVPLAGSPDTNWQIHWSTIYPLD